MHTCYSPVRRSPAGEGKPSPPLPLDLHVLSLSLAFILSQDQTLRCWYIVFFLFQEVLFGLTRNLPALKLSFVRFPTRLSPYKYCVVDLGKLTELLALVLLHRYCKSFNVLSSGPLRPRSVRFRTALQSYGVFSFRPNFPAKKFFRALNIPATPPVMDCRTCCPPCGRTPAGVRFVPESGCKITTLFNSHQIFLQLFS